MLARLPISTDVGMNSVVNSVMNSSLKMTINRGSPSLPLYSILYQETLSLSHDLFSLYVISLAKLYKYWKILIRNRSVEVTITVFQITPIE